MVCSKCGSQIMPGSRFCMSCGTPVDTGQENMPVSPQQGADYQGGGNYQQPNLQGGGNYQQPNMQGGGNYQQPNMQGGGNYQQPNMQGGGNYQQPNMQGGGNYQQPNMQGGMNAQQPYGQPLQTPQSYQAPYGYQTPPGYGGTPSISLPEFLKKYTGFDLYKFIDSLRRDPSVRWKWITMAGALLILLFGLLPTFTKVGYREATYNFYARFNPDHADLDILYLWVPAMLEVSVLWVLLFALIDQPLWTLPALAVIGTELMVLIGWMKFHVTVGIWFMLLAVLFTIASACFSFWLRRQRKARFGY